MLQCARSVRDVPTPQTIFFALRSTAERSFFEIVTWSAKSAGFLPIITLISLHDRDWSNSDRCPPDCGTLTKTKSSPRRTSKMSSRQKIILRSRRYRSGNVRGQPAKAQPIDGKTTSTKRLLIQPPQYFQCLSTSDKHRTALM